MKKIFFLVVISAWLGFAWWYWQRSQSVFDASNSQNEKSSSEVDIPILKEGQGISHIQTNLREDEISVPLDRIKDRIIKKPFGILIDPKTSPIQPERFRGYHTGMDFETFEDEANRDVFVRAICDGEILERRFVSGYGGVVVTNCVMSNQPITVVYGHLVPTSSLWERGDLVRKGEELGRLGKGGSHETDGERKHLHLGVHRGTMMDLRGYVDTQRELSAWVDPTFLLATE